MHSHLRTLRWATWLGWQIEANWTAPALFALYVVIKPLAGSMLLVCMYWAACAARGASAPDYLSFLYVSSACFMLMGGLTHGMSNAVVTDRESFGMLKFIRISPGSFPTYLVGRGVARTAQATIGATITILVGLWLFPDLRQTLLGGSVSWAWLACYLLEGAVMIVSMGLVLSGAVLNMARYGMFLSEGIIGVLYLLCGAVFPIDILPPWLQPVSLVLPPTYWLEGMRRALLGAPRDDTYLASLDHAQLALRLLLGTLALTIVAIRFFRWSERRAWRLGRFDEISTN